MCCRFEDGNPVVSDLKKPCIHDVLAMSQNTLSTLVKHVKIRDLYQLHQLRLSSNEEPPNPSKASYHQTKNNSMRQNRLHLAFWGWESHPVYFEGFGVFTIKGF